MARYEVVADPLNVVVRDERGGIAEAFERTGQFESAQAIDAHLARLGYRLDGVWSSERTSQGMVHRRWLSK